MKTISKTGHLSDVTRMRTVYDYVRNQFEGVQYIVDVQDYDLGEIGDLMYQDATQEDAARFIQLARNLEVIVHRSADACPIPETNAVDVILLPPFYLVNDRKIIFK